LFNAPVNPNVSLYRTSADRNTYHQFLTGITEQFNIPLYDFEDTVPSEYWGSLLNGPDPLHMGRKGHQILAGRILDTLRTVTATSVTAKGS
jgi:lysophospholipase L1-like esterase